jgi:hypothetical protein
VFLRVQELPEFFAREGAFALPSFLSDCGSTSVCNIDQY